MEQVSDQHGTSNDHSLLIVTLHIVFGAITYGAVMLAIYYVAVEFAGFGAVGVM